MKDLFKDFETITTDQWKSRLEKDLKGITFDQLSKIDKNNITVHPFYTKGDNSFQPLFQHTDWSIIQHIAVDDAKSANQIALAQLNDGASGLLFEMLTPVNIDLLLQDIELPYITVVFETNDPAIQEHIAHFIKNKYSEPQHLNVYVNTSQIFESSISINGVAYNNSGANSTTELAAIASELNEQLHQMEQKNNIAHLQQVYISVAVDTTFYEQITKLRAIRIIAQNLLKAYNTTAQIYIHAVTSHVYRSHIDMHSNLLRDTLAAMASVLGGANGVTVYPYDYAVNTTSDFSRRMAKNIQLLLKEESYLHQVADVSAGSYYIESLTAAMADKVWQTFQHWEQQGGWLHIQDFLQTIIKEQATNLIQGYKEGKYILIGVNKFKNNMETDIPAFRQEFIKHNYINIAQALA
jgi:methylmalonyl-CoA mutase